MYDDASGGWRDVLQCPFFSTTVLRMLGPKFIEQGFAANPPTAAIEHLVFCGSNGCIELAYESEPLPPYRPVVLVTRALPDDPRSRAESVPLWFLIPEDAPCRNYWQWTFRSEEELEPVLERLWEEIIVPYAIPTAAESERLTAAIMEFARS
ncbi:MAG TPA: hypothetical protein VLT59_09435 [Steroidobacteraceae bacterium]|nr:hypothetical protein [Steroidobacteraceae bacterium]